MKKGRVVLTGANGFIGRHLGTLLLERGHEVLGIVRSAEAMKSLPHPTVLRDLELAESISDVLCPGDTIVHLASRAHVMTERASDPDALYRAANVAPVRMICESAIRAGVNRVVYVSSAKVFGEGRASAYTLGDALAPRDAYARSKVQAEEVIRLAGQDGQLAWTILRPPFVYGQGGKGNFPRLVRLARLSAVLPLPIGGVHNGRSMVYVGNLVDAIHACIVSSAARNRIFLPTDENAVSTPELLRAIGKTEGRHIRLFSTNAGLLRLLGRACGYEAEMDRLIGSFLVDGSALMTQLSWRQPYDLERALALSLNRDT